MSVIIKDLYVGRPKKQEYDGRSYISSISKRAVDHLVVNLKSIVDDDVCNKLHHGGPQRVLHHYPYEHYKKLSCLSSVFLN